MKNVTGMLIVLTMSFIVLSATGCSSSKTDKASTDQKETLTKASGEKNNGKQASDDHSGWWCAAHGVPEAECALCDTSLIAEFKAKGDWCKEHDRPESQCFKCDPTRAKHFADRYEAKFGKQPPKPTE